MRIILAIKSLDQIKGGAERVLTTIANGLCRRGHEVYVLSFDRLGGPSFFPLDAAVRRLYCDVGDSHARTRFYDFTRRIFRLRAEVQKNKPDAVVAFMHSMFVPMAFSLVGTGIPVIASEHIVPDHYKNRKMEYILLIAASFFVRCITVLSGSITDLYPGMIRHKMVAISNPVAIENGLSRGGAKEGSRKIILNIGRLDPQKDQKTLIEAFSTLADRYPDWDVRIVGEGNLLDALQRQIDGLDLQGRITLVGTTNQVGREYAEADIFVLPSLYESFGMVTVEAMSFGIPVIGFAECTGTNEIISDGENGLLVQGTDRVATLAEGMDRLMKDEELRRRLGKAGPKSVAAYGVEPVLDRWETLLRESVSAP